MTAPGFVLLRTAFKKVCDAEAAAHGRGPEIAPQAAQRLLALLTSGDLRTWRFGPTGSDEVITADYWRDRGGSFRHDILPMDAFGGIMVNEGELRLLLVQAGDAAASSEPSTDPKHETRGRNPKANPYDIAWIVGLLVYEDAWGTSQDDMYLKIVELYEKHYGDNSAPSRSTLQPMIRRLLAEMGKYDAEVDKRSTKARK